MSTNFYVHTPDGQEIHLGKRSAGWSFTFRGYPERGVRDYESWRAQFALGEIRDEYGVVRTPEEMEQIVAEQRSFLRVHGRMYRDQHEDDRGNRFTNVEFC